MELLVGVENDTGSCLLKLNTRTGDVFTCPIMPEISRINYVTDFKDKIIAVGNDDELNSKIVFIDKDFSCDATIFSCVNSKGIVSAIPVLENKIYVASSNTNSINTLLFSKDCKHLISDKEHYILQERNKNISCLCLHNGRWFASLCGNNPESEDDGCIVEVSNERVLYTCCKNPTGIIFNSKNQLCFCESGANKVILGKQSICVYAEPISIVEDKDVGGYWAAINSKNGPYIVFISYNYIEGRILYLGNHCSKCYHIVKFRGN